MDEDVRIAVYELQQRVAALEAHLASMGGDAGAAPFVAPATPGSPEDDPEVRQLLQAGNEIGAIKLWRERTNLGLAEAKHAVDQARTRLGL